MLKVENILISDELIHTQFACKTSACLGTCCVQGDYGAPLLLTEIDEIKTNLPNLLPFMEPEAVNFLNINGFHETDFEEEECTTCLPTGACVFVKWDGLIATCAIENANRSNQSTFLKPISCHLYPIRAKKIGSYTALNLHKWDICSPAYQNGAEQNTYVSDFLTGPLTRAYGEKWVAKFKKTIQKIRGKSAE